MSFMTLLRQEFARTCDYCCLLLLCIHVAVDPVVQGKTRAEQFIKNDSKGTDMYIYNVLLLGVQYSEPFTKSD